MKSIFVDCNNQLAPVFARVQRPGDPPIAVNSEPFQSADLPRLLAGYDICLDDHSYMPTEIMAECRGLRHIVFLGTGASSYMDVPALSKLGIEVHTIKGYGDIAVAEHTMALMFAGCRDLARMDRAVRAGTWDPVESMQLNGKTLGLIGLGGIGREVARMARGIGMEVIAWNRSPRADAGVPLVALDELLARADVISLHLALTDETRGLLDAKRLARTKPRRHPGQHGARRAGRGSRAARRAPQRPHPPCRPRRISCRAARARPSAGADGERDAHLPCRLPHARSIGDADAAGHRHRARRRAGDAKS